MKCDLFISLFIIIVINFVLGTGFWISCGGVCRYSSILVALEATFKFVPHRFPSMPNSDCSRRRVMLMPF